MDDHEEIFRGSNVGNCGQKICREKYLQRNQHVGTLKVHFDMELKKITCFVFLSNLGKHKVWSVLVIYVLCIF